MKEIIDRIIEFKQTNPSAVKQDVSNFLLQNFDVEQKRSVITSEAFTIRICEVNGKFFPNVVLSLKTLLNYDHLPFIVCAVTPETVFFRLANTSFLKKISHSSKNLTSNNICGSFLGTDIVTVYNSKENSPKNFLQLFSLHRKNNKQETLRKIIRETKHIQSKTSKFVVTPSSRKIILDAPNRFAKLLKSQEWSEVEEKYKLDVKNNGAEILKLANLENNKIRGREIEKLLTSKQIDHDIGDIEVILSDNTILIIDIKSRLKHLSSAPKAYNIDKFLELLTHDKQAFAFPFIAIDIENEVIETKLIQPFDPIVIESTKIRHHWAGRHMRGATQLTSKVKKIFDKDFEQTVSKSKAVNMLKKFIKL